MTQPSEPPRDDRPVLNGLVALGGVALGVAVLLALVALLGTKMAGLDGDSSSPAADSTLRETMYLPTPAETTDGGGPLITLNTEDPDETGEAGDASSEPEESESTEPSESESPKQGEISLQAEQTSVAAGDRIYFSGVYPGGEGAILWVQRWQDGGWTEFQASVGVTNGTFTSYLFTGVTGVNRFRVIDRDTGTVSNEIRVRVG